MSRTGRARRRNGRDRGGFSLIELLVVLAVMTWLALMALPLTELVQRRERERELRSALWQIRGAIDAYRQAVRDGSIDATDGGSGFPPNLRVLQDGVVDRRLPGSRIYFLRSIPRDPFADPRLSAESTWALRSYASPPDRPRPGADVYDVRSRSNLVGLNGVALAEW